MSQSEMTSSVVSAASSVAHEDGFVSQYDWHDSVTPVSQPTNGPARPRNRTGILSRGHSHRSASHLASPEPSILYPSTSEDDDGGQGDIISDSGPMPRRFPPSSATSARSSSSLQSQYRNASTTSPSYPLPRISPLSSAASSSSNLVVDVPRSSNEASRSPHTTYPYPQSPDGLVHDLSRAKSISSVSSVTSTSSMEAAPFRAAPLGKIRMGYTAAPSSSTIGRGQATALRIPERDLFNVAWASGPSGSIANTQTPTPDGGGMAAFMEAAQEAAALAAGQDTPGSDGSGQSPIEHRMGGSAELPHRPAGPEVKLVNSPAAALAARQKGFLPKPVSNEWLYRNGPGLGSNLGGKPIPGAYRSLAEMTQGTAEAALIAPPAPCPSPTSKRTAAVIRSKLAKSASKLGLKPLTVVPGATPAHPRVAIEFADSASTTSEALDVQQDLISSATGAALEDPRAMNVRSQTAALTPTLLNASGGTSGDFIVRTSSATNAPLIVPRLSPRSDTVPRMSGAVGFFPGTSSSSKEIKKLAKAAVSPSVSPILRATEDEHLPSNLSLAALLIRPDSRSSIGRPFSKSRPSSSLSAIAAPNVDAVAAAATSNHHSSVSSEPTPAEVVRMEAKAGIARLPTVGSGPTPGPTPILRSLSPSSPPVASSAQPHPDALPTSTVASLPPSTVIKDFKGIPSTSMTAGASSTALSSRSHPVIARSSSSQSQASLSSSNSQPSSFGGARTNGRLTSGHSQRHLSLQQLEEEASFSGVTLRRDNRSEERHAPTESSTVADDLPGQRSTELENQRQSGREALASPRPRSENISSADEDDGFELGAEAPGAANSPKGQAPIAQGQLLRPSPTRPGKSQLSAAQSGKGKIEKLSYSTHIAAGYPSAASVAPPMLRMESTNTAVSKAVSDTSDMAPLVPFKKPAKMAAGRMDPSELRYDVMENPGGEKGESDVVTADGGAGHSNLEVHALTAGADADRLSVIAETSPDTRSSRGCTDTGEDNMPPAASYDSRASHDSKLTESRLPRGMAAAMPSARPRGRDDFEFGDILGEGSYSTVILAWDLLTHPAPASTRPKPVTSVASALSGSGSKADASLREGKRAYAIKVLDKVHILKERKQKYVSVEKEALTLLVRQPGIVRLYWTFQDQESLYFVLELAPNGELLTFIKRYGSFSEKTTRYYAAQLLDAIAGMHALGVIHRDVKPENVLLDDKMRVKVTDFGSAKIIKKPASDISNEATPELKRTNSFVGTAEYVSPELLTDKAASSASDLWAFGCVVFQMLTGRPPFKALSEYQTFQKIIKREFEMPSELSKDATDLLDNLLALEPEKRLREDQIRSHPFFEGIDWNNLWGSDAPAIETGIRAPPPRKEVREPSSDSMFDVFGEEDWANDEEFASTEDPLVDVGTDVEPCPPHHLMPIADSSDEEANNEDGNSHTASADIISLQSGHRADVEGEESPDSSHSFLPSRQATAPRSSAPPVPTAWRPPSTASERSSPRAHSPAPPCRQPPPAFLNWAALLLPHEAVLYASPTIHRRTGTANLQSKKRMLILTDFPRLLCVKEDAQSLKVKSEVLLTLPGNGANQKQLNAGGSQNALSTSSASTVSSSMNTRRASVSGIPSTLYVINTPSSTASLQSNPNVLLSIEQKGTKTIVVHTPVRSYTYDDPSGDASNWVRSLLSAAGKR